MKKWIEMIAEHIAQRERISVDDIFLVWSCKTLQNWKGIFSVTGQDKLLPLLYEIMYNGDKDEYYADRYVKTENKVYKPAELFWTKWTNENTAEEKNLSEHEWVIPGEF